MAVEQSAPYSLSKSRRACLAALELPRFQAEARHRELSGRSDPTQQKVPRWRRTAEAQAGAAFGVSAELVRRARRLQERRSKLFNRVLAGQLPLREAEDKAAPDAVGDDVAERLKPVYVNITMELETTKGRKGRLNWPFTLTSEALERTPRQLMETIGGKLVRQLVVNGLPQELATMWAKAACRQAVEIITYEGWPSRSRSWEPGSPSGALPP
jgi:hypothetical protein